MNLLSKNTVSGLASLVVGLLCVLGLLAYGVTDEVPVGGVNGQVIMAENGKPLPKAFVTLSLIDPSIYNTDADIESEHHFRADKDGRFHLPHLVSGDYLFSVEAKAHRIDKFSVRITEGTPTQVTLPAKADKPRLELYGTQHVYLPQEAPNLQLNGFSTESSLKVSIYKLDFDKVIEDGGLYNALAPLARADNGKVTDPSTMGSQINTFSDTSFEKDAEGTFSQKLPVPSLPEGLYWVECKLGDIDRGTWLSVSNIALVAKHVNSDVAAYVTRLDTGQPVGGAEVGYASPHGFMPLGHSSGQGLLRFSSAPPKGMKATVVVAVDGNSRALLDFNQGSYDGGEGDESGSSGDNSQVRIYSFTDRPIYRPGDLVQYKGLVRKLVGSNYVLPDQPTVTVEIQDEDGTVLHSETLKLGPMGSYSGSYQFGQDALPANYQLITHYGKTTASKDIGVAAYRKPSYSITVQPEKKRYVRGDKVRMDVATKYYYGAPVVGAKVQATVSRSPYWDWSDYSDEEQEYTDEGDADYSADVSYPGQSLYSYGGETTQTINTTTDANGKAVIEFPTVGVNEAAEAENDYSYTVEVDVTDQGNKTFSGQGSVDVMRSDYNLKLKTNSYVTTAGDEFQVNATVKGADGNPVAGLPVRFTSGYERWTRSKEVLDDTLVQEGVTGPDGQVNVKFKPPTPGFYEIKAEIADDRGHTVTTRTWQFLEGNPSPYFEPPPATQLKVTLDRRSYKAGDTAKALITCRDPGGDAFVGVEADGIYKVDTVQLTSKVTVYRFKVSQDCVPDAFFSVAYVRNKKFYQDSRRLLVDLGIRRLSVQVTSDKTVYHPGDTAVYTIQTRYQNGKPAKADVSLGVVDESIYAIFDDQSDIVKGFYPKRYDAVGMEYSFPELYLGGGDKAPTSIQIRRNFKDTAFWEPSVMTDVNGQAKISVKLPDNLTSWRATVRAITAETDVGQSTVNVIARKDLMIQLATPIFVVNGDQQRLAAMITNNTGADADVNVNLTSSGATLSGDTNTKVHVSNGAMQTVEYTMSPSQSGTASFIGKAWVNNGASDGMELKVPVLPHARLSVNGSAGATSSKDTVKLTLDGKSDPNSGGVEISVAPSAAASLLPAIDALVGYPYGCTEQTTSRFLPSVVFAKAATEMGLPKPKLADQIPQIVQDSYSRLEAMEHSDGAWGWWEYDQDDDYMTAYVLEAIYRAKAAGFPPPNGLHVSAALDWAEKEIASPLPQPSSPNSMVSSRAATDRWYLTYALALHGRLAPVLKLVKTADTSKLDAAQSAYVALCAGLLGQDGAAKKDAALSRMLLLAEHTPNTTYWAEQDWWGFETTARCFYALETLRPNDPNLKKVVVYLMQSRRGDMWFSTRDTSAVIMAMADYLKRTKELLTDAAFTIKLNGQTVNSLSVTKSAALRSGSTLKLTIAQLKQGDNTLEFDADKGTCYYTVVFKQYVTADQLGAQGSSALNIERAYYKLESQRMEDGTLKLTPSRDPVTEVHAGDILQCQITINANAARDYVLVTDPIPSNCHVTAREDVGEGETWDWWWSKTAILDDHVAFFARNIPGGKSVITYTMQAENPGVSRALPTEAYNMYDAADSASGGELSLKVDP